MLTDSLSVIAVLVALFGSAALLLWLIERVSKWIGGKRTWFLTLVGLPLLISVSASISLWDNLVWWERAIFPLSGPVIAAVGLILAFAAFNPADALALVFGLICKAWEMTVKKVRGAKNDS